MTHFRGTTRHTAFSVRRVMAVLQYQKYTKGRCPGFKELARLMDVPYSTLRYYLIILRDDYGLITWESRTSNSIRILRTVSGGD